jgi:outer membrane protein assembly factor BamE (lipoprotein component of BamABCDE complex)
MIRICLSLLFLALCVGCNKPLPELKGIDVPGWKNDANGCNNQRASMRTAIDREKEKLLGLDEVQTVKLLGSPDQEELYSRNQKFYYYFIDPAAQCATGNDSTAEKLVIRFNAVGLAKEVSIVSGEW